MQKREKILVGVLGVVLLIFLLQQTSTLFNAEEQSTIKEYGTSDLQKFLGQPQTAYPKKNWSSFMLMNCNKCSSLTPDYVNRASGLELHQFKWLEGDHLIGDLPLEWNWLVGEYEHKDDVNNVHFTKGGPWFEEYAKCDYSQDWFKNLEESNGSGV